jgi:hypothetical protein
MRCAASPPLISQSAGISDRRSPSTASNRLPPVSRVEVIRQDFRREGFSESLVSLLLAGNRASTYSTYESAWRNWVYWCSRRNENPLSVPIASALEFIAGLYREGRSYSSLNAHRHMLSKTLPPIDGHPIGIHPLVKNLLNGCYNLNPPKPNYNCSRDPSVVIQFMATLDSSIHELDDDR